MVLCELFFGKERGCGDTLGVGILHHHLRLDKLVAHCATGHHDPGRDSRAILPDSLEDARLGEGRDGAITCGGIAQHQNHIEFVLLRVGHGDGEVQNCNAGDGCRRHDSEDAEKFSSLLKQRC